MPERFSVENPGIRAVESGTSARFPDYPAPAANPARSRDGQAVG